MLTRIQTATKQPTWTQKRLVSLLLLCCCCRLIVDSQIDWISIRGQLASSVAAAGIRQCTFQTIPDQISENRRPPPPPPTGHDAAAPTYTTAKLQPHAFYRLYAGIRSSASPLRHYTVECTYYTNIIRLNASTIYANVQSNAPILLYYMVECIYHICECTIKCTYYTILNGWMHSPYMQMYDRMHLLYNTILSNASTIHMNV
jgi:hypothetical protein